MRFLEFKITYNELLLEVSNRLRAETKARFRKKNPELSDEEIDPYLDKWDDVFELFPKAEQNIQQIPSFERLKQLIDIEAPHLERERDAEKEVLGKKKPELNYDETLDTLHDKNNLVIMKGDLREKCIQYGKGYSWCISRADASNMFYSYRMRYSEPMFYFVFDKDKPKEDIWHAVVIYVDNDDIIKVATADNPGDVTMTWDEILEKQPKLRGLENIFVHKPLSDQEKEDYDYFKREVDDEKYASMSFYHKLKYIKFGHKLTPEQQEITARSKSPRDIALLGLYAKLNPKEITTETYKIIKDGDKRKIKNDLLRAYEDYSTSFADISKIYREVIIPIDKEWPELLNLALEKESFYRISDTMDMLGLDEWPELEKKLLDSDNTRRMAEYAKNFKPDGWPEAEKKVLSSDYMFEKIDYAEKVYPDGWPELEKSILDSKKSRDIAKYAIEVKKKPWPEGEEAMINSDHNDGITTYVKELKPDGWPEGEDVILKSRWNHEKIRHAKEVYPDGWPALEKQLLDELSGFGLGKYAKEFKSDGWPEAEQAVLDSGDADSIAAYADEMKQDGWPEGEGIILSSSDNNNAIIRYAKKVYPDGWPEGEDVILNSRDIYDISRYATDVIKKAWPEAETIILGLEDTNLWQIKAYIEKFKPNGWPELEEKLINSKDFYEIMQYAKEFKSDGWPEAEAVLKDNSYYWDEYQNLISKAGNKDKDEE